LIKKNYFFVVFYQINLFSFEIANKQPIKTMLALMNFKRKNKMSQNNKPDLPQLKKKTPAHQRHPLSRIIILMTVVLVASFGIFFVRRFFDPSTYFSDLQEFYQTQIKYQKATGSFNAIVIGSDERKNQTIGHTDTIMLVHANLTRHRYTVVSIPRDSRIYLNNIGHTKLTSVQSVYQEKYGAKKGTLRAVEALSAYLNVPINYYLETNYWGLRSMVNTIGGITVDLPFSVTLTHPWYQEDYHKFFTQGKHHLDGKMVAEIVHERDSVPGTDFGRQRLQKAALIGIINQVTKPANALKIPTLAKSMSKFLVATNLKPTDLISIALAVRGNFDAQKQIHYYQLSGRNKILYDNVLQNYNDQLILNRNQLDKIIEQNFEN
jgi:LCP family protein required for cell wall assembly